MTRDVAAGSGRIAAVGLSGHMSSLVALDRSGKPLRPCITVADGRGAAEADWLAAQFGARIERLTGGRATTSDVAPMLIWLKRHEPHVYARMATFVAAKDYVRFLLTDQLATEATDAGNTLFFDLVGREWDVDLVVDLGLDPAKLPALVGTTDVVGCVSAAAAAATGLSPGIPVVAGAADMAASVTGTATLEPGIVAVTIGTSAQVTTPIRALLPQAHGRISVHPHADGNLLYAMGSVFGGGMALGWLASVFGERRALEVDPRYYDRFSAEAAEASTGSGGVLFLPFLLGSGSPDFDPLMRAGFVGLSLTARRADMVRAVLEGVAYNLRECVDLLRELDLPVRRLHIGGGGAASTVWRSIVADVLGTRIHPVRVHDASAVGAAALAAVAVGAYADVRAAATAMVRIEDPIEPEPDAVDVYERGYRDYLDWRSAARDLSHHAAAQGSPSPAQEGAAGHANTNPA